MTLFLVDDHPLFLEGLQAVLQPGFDILGTAQNLADARALIPKTHPQIVLTDLRLPDGSGIDLIKEYRSLPIKFIILTSFDSGCDVTAAMDAGASGYLLKDTSGAEIRSAIRRVLAGAQVMAPTVATQLWQQSRSNHAPLSSRELEVLQLVAAGKNNGEIASLLFVAESTVKTHLQHIFDKLGVCDRTSAVVQASKRGDLIL
ncbi:MAG: response regulator transcription factor [Acidobacteria bacterium]|nr:response regulator transcription factor [Acidobacteriota bacterium]